MNKHVKGLVALVLSINLSACGYLLYPERVGQRSGQLDPTVILLDAGGLLIGILPGVVAFAVDLTTGTIFLSPGEKSAIEKHKDKMSTIEELSLTPVERASALIDSAHTAEQLSSLIGQPIDESQISYFKTAESKPLMLTMATSTRF